MQRAADAAVDQSIAEIEKSLPQTRKTPRDPAAGRADRDRSATPAPCAPWSAAAIFAPATSIAPRVARRQPGSAFKPFVYAAAVEDGFGPDDLIEDLDEPVEASNAAWTPDDEHVDDEVADAARRPAAVEQSRRRAAAEPRSDCGRR